MFVHKREISCKKSKEAEGEEVKTLEGEARGQKKTKREELMTENSQEGTAKDLEHLLW